jgi:hypothetical protein
MGQRGQLDRLTLAHSGPVMALDWCSSSARVSNNSSGGVGDVGNASSGHGWIVSGGLDRCVKVRFLPVGSHFERECPFQGVGLDDAWVEHPHPVQTILHPTSLLSRAASYLAPIIRMRTRGRVQ